MKSGLTSVWGDIITFVIYCFIGMAIYRIGHRSGYWRGRLFEMARNIQFWKDERALQETAFEQGWSQTEFTIASDNLFYMTYGDD